MDITKVSYAELIEMKRKLDKEIEESIENEQYFDLYEMEKVMGEIQRRNELRIELEGGE